ncbi:MAG: succinyl-diaminopimelate desuccinylase [Gammaproteobacteria bacterium]|nr:succinyl-diaminopimelate desuccinylase [Gammaproteobacteria bacterium]
MSETLELTKNLISRSSVTPDDKGCQELMIKRLEAIGFVIEKLRFEEVDNFWARRGISSPLIAFAGHTDVVPTGPESDWKYPPFEPTIEGDLLYGRGTADMKGSLAAMVVGCENFVKAHPDHKGSIAFLITSDEEGPSINGTIKVVEHLENRNEKIDFCLVGEPSSTNKVGDIVKNGRRGSLNGKLIVNGIQGHVAYPHLANNPFHVAAPALAELCKQTWDNGNEFFPPTTFQISNLNCGTGATNVIPGKLEMLFNFRFSTEVTADDLKKRVHELFDTYDMEYSIDWNLSGQPFITGRGELVSAVQVAVKEVAGYETELSTAGGTSDGRFIAPTGAQIVELGPLNATIHQVNECVSISDLDKLTKMYEVMLRELLV